MEEIRLTTRKPKSILSGVNPQQERIVSFKKVQEQIEKKDKVGKQAAGAILASSTRNASAAAKKANPSLKKVK